ncbi:two-component system sensor histidine kinase NtrB [Cohnella thermotolerans]|jgi:two-component system, sporulation sensor kinase E|uniref:two-component system sensor histidine kinase NtrB n=1 Tax=Cohnella thermotolerans TaxID=329858 RepID=UPI0003FD0EDB|nr:ATP-binding protein [Cohnella thermotolerans]
MDNSKNRDIPKHQDQQSDWEFEEARSREPRKEKFVRRFLENLLGHENFGVLLLDADFRIVEASPMVCQAIGREREELLGQNAESLFRLQTVPLPVDASLLQGRVFRNRSYTWRSGDRRREWVLDGELLRDGDGGKVIGAYVLFRDVTQLMALEEQVRRSDRLKMIGEVAAGTAHEIRNPLTAIRGFIQLLHRSLAERQMNRELDYVDIVLAELERVNALVNEFLLLSKPKKVELQPVRLGKLFDEMLPMLRNEAVMHNVTLQYIPRNELPSIFADKELLKQVFLNLGKNAIEAMTEGGMLIIRERPCPPGAAEVTVDVCDNGPGIPEEMIDRVFDPFFTTKEQGTGLGLSICQRIVHELGGRIEVSSGTGGTVFSVTIPAIGASQRKPSPGGGALPSDDV